MPNEASPIVSDVEIVLLGLASAVRDWVGLLPTPPGVLPCLQQAEEVIRERRISERVRSLVNPQWHRVDIA